MSDERLAEIMRDLHAGRLPNHDARQALIREVDRLRRPARVLSAGGEMSDTTHLVDGRWVPAIPLPYYLHFRMRCACGRKFWTVEGYEGHYALAHILRGITPRNI